jgi:hypothetical protein
MRFTSLVILVGTALLMTAVPAQAQWRGYISRDLGFALRAPGEIVAERGTYEGERSGEHPTIVYRSIADNIEYKMVVTDFRERADEGASLLVEAAFMFQDERNVLMDAYARIDDTFGRRVTIDLPDNGGRSMGSFYFHQGYLYQSFATVLPANGDFASPFIGRFIDSISFGDESVNEGVTELSLPE